MGGGCKRERCGAHGGARAGEKRGEKALCKVVPKCLQGHKMYQNAWWYSAISLPFCGAVHDACHEAMPLSVKAVIFTVIFVLNRQK